MSTKAKDQWKFRRIDQEYKTVRDYTAEDPQIAKDLQSAIVGNSFLPARLACKYQVYANVITNKMDCTQHTA